MMIEIPEDVLFQDLDDEGVLLSLASGTYYSLNETGRRMWVLLTEHGEPEAVVARLEEEYDAPADGLRTDLLSLIEELAAQHLLRILD